jgi:hypothetical protein
MTKPWAWPEYLSEAVWRFRNDTAFELVAICPYDVKTSLGSEGTIDVSGLDATLRINVHNLGIEVTLMITADPKVRYRQTFSLLDTTPVTIAEWAVACIELWFTKEGT